MVKRWRVADGVAWLTSDTAGSVPGTVYAVVLPHGSPAVFQGTAAAIWWMLIDTAESEARARQVAALNELRLADLDPEIVDAFACHLELLGFLQAS